MKTVPELESERLLLRIARAADFKSVFPIYNSHEVLDTMSFSYPLDEKKTRDWFKNARKYALNDEEQMYLLTEKQSGAFVGCAGLFKIDYYRKNGELGYWIAPAARRKGYAFEASQRVIDFSFSDYGMHKIWAETLSTNEISKALLRKLGFAETAIFREELYKNGAWRDRAYFELLKGGRHET